MRLTLECSICEARRAKQIESLTNDTKLDPIAKSLAIGMLPKSKGVSIVKETALGSKILTTYSCKHTVITEGSQSVLLSKFTSNTKGHKAYPYQVSGVEFCEQSNYNCLIADEQGLGKTVQAILAWINNPDTLSPAIFVVKPATIYQWIRMFKEWGTLDELGICPLISSKSYPLPIFKCFIISMDLLPEMVEKLIAIKPKLIVADEVQCFKNLKSARTKAFVELCQASKVPHKIFLSGTPIKNRASEYFTVLNLLAPGHFPTYKQFAMRWLEKVGKGSLNRIRPRLLDEFKRVTSRWIIRREVRDIQRDLPPMRRVTNEIEILDPLAKIRYNQQLDLFNNFLKDSTQKKDQISLLGWLAKLRHETAMMKMGECCEIVKDFLDSTEERKIAIGIHHQSVRDGLFFGLEPYGALKLSGENSAQSKDWIVQKFQRPEYRVMILNMIAGGTGLDGLQVCSDVLVMERQWNAADEEQFEKRFDRDGQKNPVLITYLMARGTIDVFFAELVDKKRAIVGETMSGYTFTNDLDSLMTLANTVIEHRL